MTRSNATLVSIGGGLISAVFFLSILSGSAGALVLAYLAPLPLFLVGFSLGVPGVTIAAAASVLGVLLTGGMFAALGYAVGTALPAVLITRQALLSRTAPDGLVAWYPPGLLLQGMMLYAAAAILVATVAASGVEGGLPALLQAELTQTLAALTGGAMEQPAEQTLATMARLVPGLVAVSWLVMTLINAVLAQGALMRFNRHLRPGMSVSELALQPWVGYAFGAALLVALVSPGLPGFVAANLAMLFGVAFVLLGCAVVHAFMRGRPAAPFVLTVFYLMMFFLAWPLLLVIGLGLVEQYTGLRRRLGGSGPGKEDE